MIIIEPICIKHIISMILGLMVISRNKELTEVKPSLTSRLLSEQDQKFAFFENYSISPVHMQISDVSWQKRQIMYLCM